MQLASSVTHSLVPRIEILATGIQHDVFWAHSTHFARRHLESVLRTLKTVSGSKAAQYQTGNLLTL
jgi:hypothetical protein